MKRWMSLDSIIENDTCQCICIFDYTWYLMMPWNILNDDDSQMLIIYPSAIEYAINSLIIESSHLFVFIPFHQLTKTLRAKII